MAVQTDTPWPATEPTSIQSTIPAYLYVQYQNDDNVAAFFTAYNQFTQAYINWFNELNLPIYTDDPVASTLLDWVAEGIYGISRPGLPSSFGSPSVGAVNTSVVNQITFNGFRAGRPSNYTATNDDTFRRIITWAFYKGDGKVFTPTWLKRRINRFLNGFNGTDVTNDTQYNISVTPTGFKQWSITLASTPQSSIFQAAVKTGVLELPFQIQWTVNLV
jgi:hypothetical protein